MADRELDNGDLPNFKADTTTLTSDVEVQRIELVTAVEGGASTNLAKAEDSAHSSGDFGIQALGARRDTPTPLAGSDGDYMPATFDSLGRMYVVLAGTNAMPGALSTTDSISAVDVGDAIMWGGVAYTPQPFTINQAAADGTAIINLSSGKKNVVVSLYAIAASAVTIKFVSGTSNTSATGVNTDLMPAMSFAANTGPNLGRNVSGHFKTAAGGALKVILGGSVQVSGFGTYIQVT